MNIDNVTLIFQGLNFIHLGFSLIKNTSKILLLLSQCFSKSLQMSGNCIPYSEVKTKCNVNVTDETLNTSYCIRF